MKHTTSILIVFFLVIQIYAQDEIFAGSSLRFENNAIGINTGIKKELANLGLGGLIEVSYYPYKRKEDRDVDAFYLTYAGINLGGYYNFYLRNNFTIYPQAGMAINSIQGKVKIENINVKDEFVKSQIHLALGGFYGVGFLKKLGNVNFITNIRHEFTDIGSLKLFVGLAYKFSGSPNDK